jgi:serine/threonine protein kinase
MHEDNIFQSLLTEGLAPPRSTPVIDIPAFIDAIGLSTIGEYSYLSNLSGGGTNFTALYGNEKTTVVAKFFFTGPAGAGDAACDREFKMLKLCHSQELVTGIMVAPRVIQEFASNDKMVVGFLMEYVQGETLQDLMGRILPGDFHASMTTFVRIGWARHNALRASILHKDLHPGNIVFELGNEEWEHWIFNQDVESPRVRILDFGSAVMPMQFAYDGSDANWLYAVSSGNGRPAR